MRFKEYDRYDATGLAKLISSGQVAAIEVLEAALERVDTNEQTLNAISSQCRKRATDQANGDLGLGPFVGVPFLLKDIQQDYVGLPMTYGATALRDHVPTKNAGIVDRFLEAGVVILGSTTTSELGLKGTTETTLNGATRNPWDVLRTPGGSSGGAAAAVAAGYVPMAGASDGGGSIRIPASYCGLFGLKPSRGRVSMGPEHAELAHGSVIHHALTRSVRDSAGLLDVLSVPRAGDPFIIQPLKRPLANEVGVSPGQLRIGFSTSSPIGGRVDKACVEGVLKAARLLEELDHHVEEAAPAIDGNALAQTYLAILCANVGALVQNIANFTGKSNRLLQMDTRLVAAIGRTMSASQFVSISSSWNTFARALGDFHKRFDIYMTPTVAMTPPKIGELESSWYVKALINLFLEVGATSLLARARVLEEISFKNLERTPFTLLGSMTFGPGMSVPLHSDEEGLPVGVLFNARFGEEETLIRLASQLEEAFPWNTCRAPDARAFKSS